MKLRLQLPLTACLYALAAPVIWADATPATNPTSSPAFSSPLALTNLDINPNIPGDSVFKSSTTTIPDVPSYDPETTPPPTETRNSLTPQESAALQEKKYNDSNWLLQGYEESMRQNSTSQEDTTTREKNDLYLQITSDPELAKIAGVPFHAPSDPSSVTTFHTGAANPAQSDATLRDDPSLKSNDKKNKPFFSQFLQPFLAPLNSSEGKTTNANFYGNSTSNADLPKMTSPLESSPQDADTDPLTLETPGLTAAQGDPLLNKGGVDSSLDTLPGESMAHAEAHQDFFTSSEPPAGSDMVQMQKQQKNSLNPPEAPRTAPPIAISPLLLTPQDTSSAPKFGVAAPAPVRPHVADPRDFLDR